MGRSRIVTPWERSHVRTELDQIVTATERARADLAEADESVSRILSAESVDDVDWDEIRDLAGDAEEQVGSAKEIMNYLVEYRLLRTALDESSVADIDEMKTTAEQAEENLTEWYESLERAVERADRGETDAAEQELSLAHYAIEQGFDHVETISNAANSAQSPEPTRERDWVDLIKDTIPIEVLGAWTFIAALVTATPGFNNDWYWGIFAAIVVATALHAFQDILLSDEPDEADASGYVASLPGGATDGGNDDPPDPDVAAAHVFARWSAVVHILLAVAAFAVWVYYLGGPFLKSGLHDPTIAAIALPLTVVAGPQLFYLYVWIPATIELRLTS